MTFTLSNKRKACSVSLKTHSSKKKKMKMEAAKVSKGTLTNTVIKDRKYKIDMKKQQKEQINFVNEKLDKEGLLDENILDQLDGSSDDSLGLNNDIETRNTSDIELENCVEKGTSRRARAAQKELAKERKAMKSNADIISQAKYVWEQVRCRSISTEERERLVMQLDGIVKGQVHSIIFKHDASRIIQTLVKYASKSQRISIAEELKGNFIDLSKSVYGKFLVVKLLHHGTVEIKEMILREFDKKILKLIRHKEASYVLEEAFRDYTNSKQKNSILQEFYGPEFAIFKRLDGPHSLDKILEANPEKRESIVRNLRENLAPILDKGVFGFTLVHRLLFDYMTHANRVEAEALVSSLQEQVPEIVHTKYGSEAAMLLFAYSPPKSRKTIVKSCKPFIVKMAKDEFGHMVVIAMLDILDDTVLSYKSIIAELEPRLEELCTSKYGRKVILYLLIGPSPRYFFKQNLITLEKCHEIRKETSKKEITIRKNELVSKILPSLLELVTKKLKLLVGNSIGCQVVTEVILNAEANLSSIPDLLVELASGDPTESQHIVHLSYACRLYKTCVQGGHFNSDKNINLGFGNKLIDSILPYIEAWVEGDGAFIVLAALESPNVDAMRKEQVVSRLSSHLCRLQDVGEQSARKGTKLVVELLKKWKPSQSSRVG